MLNLLRVHFSDPVEGFSEFLWWATPNVGLALLQILVLILVLWTANITPRIESILANSVLLFYATSLMGTTIYSLKKRSELVSGYGLGLLLFVSLITGIYYAWGQVVAHDPGLTLKPLWDRRVFLEINIALLVTIFAFSIDLKERKK